MPKIIVGVDESERSKDAVALAARLSRGSDAELLLVCAYPYDDVPGLGATTGYRQYLREDALAALEEAASAIPAHPHVQTRAIPDLAPARAIQELATRERASLIVIGSSHRGALGRVFAGTTAERLLHGAPCPVAVVPGGYAESGGEIGTIAVGWDGSPESTAAVVGAAAVAGRGGGLLRIGRVLDADDDADEGGALPRTLPAGLRLEHVLRHGDPVAVLAAASEDADLLVLGSRGYGPHRAVLLGSVSRHVVNDALCSVLVVPRGVRTLGDIPAAR